MPSKYCLRVYIPAKSIWEARTLAMKIQGLHANLDYSIECTSCETDFYIKGTKHEADCPNRTEME